MARDDPQTKLRLPPELKAWVEAQAAENGRSVNAELVWMIEFVKREYDAAMKAQSEDAAETRRIAERALQVAEEAKARWEQIARDNGMLPQFKGFRSDAD